MSDETMLTAARRVVRFFRIDEITGGGLISIETIKAVTTLNEMVLREQGLRYGDEGLSRAAETPDPEADVEARLDGEAEASPEVGPNGHGVQETNESIEYVGVHG